jgi:ABC-type glycerol-3-phosphate transport system substrate-binding protein
VRLRKVGRIRAAAAVAAVALVASACVSGGGGGGEDTQPQASVEPITPTEPTEPVSISFASWVGESPQMKQLATQFQKLHPNITIEFQNVPAERARDKLITQIAGGNAPDVAYMDSGSVQDFSSRGALVNLDGYIAGSDVIQLDDYVQGFRDSATFEGSMFALPFDGETTGLFYRTDLFQEAGLDPDAPPATWEEFQSAAQALTDPAEKKYGFALFAPESAYYFYPWLWQAGGELISEDGSQILFDSPEGQEAAEFFVGLRDYAPPDYYNSNSWDGRVAFATGKVGMYMAGSWLAGELLGSFPQIEGKWATAPLPEGPAGCATTLAGDSLAMFEGTENADAAFLWMEFLSRPENMSLWTFGQEFATLLPPRTSLLESPELSEKKPFLEGFAANMSCAVTSNIVQPRWPEVEQELNLKLGEAIFGDITATEALSEAAITGQEIIDEG